MTNLTIYTFHATIRCQYDKRNVTQDKVEQDGPTVAKAMDMAEAKLAEEYPNCDISLSFGNRTPAPLRWHGHEKPEAHRPQRSEALTAKLADLAKLQGAVA